MTGDLSSDSRPGTAPPRRLPRTLARRLLLWGVLACFAMAACVVAALWMLSSGHELREWSGGLRAAKPYLVIAHCAVIAALWLYWGELFGWLRNRGLITAEVATEMLRRRHRAAVFLLVFEWLVVVRWPLGQW